MYRIDNGILFHDGTPVFALGQSYYASFNSKKVPIAPGEDRTEEMKKDLRELAECGFNLVRTSALGTVRQESDGTVRCDYPWTDEMVQFLQDELDMPAMIRLQGYGVNFSGKTDALMLDQFDNSIPEPPNSTFLPFCLQHPVIRRENGDMTEAASAHFRHSPAVVANLIFNEPHYTWMDPERNSPFYDFNPHAIMAWRKWMVEKGYCKPEDAEKLKSPRNLPRTGNPEEVELFTRWLMFRMEALNDFIGDMGDRAGMGNPGTAGTSCQIAWIHRPGSAMLGVEYFRMAKRLDFMGITDYLPTAGPAFYYSGMTLDAVESAAATFGKHAWLIEYNCRTNLPGAEWLRETVAAVSSGIKGIVYYNFRADYPVPGTPEPEQYGLIFSNREHTSKYETVRKTNRLITKLQHYFVSAEKERCGVAILDSAHARAMGFALTGRFEPEIVNAKHIYTDLLRAGYQVDFTRACDLERNPLRVNVLFLPLFDHLSDEEKEQVRAFEKKGGRLVSFDYGFYGGYYPAEPPPYNRDFELSKDIFQDVPGVMNQLGIKPVYEVASPYLGVRILRANDNSFLTVGLINTDSQERPVPAGVLKLRLPDTGAFKHAELHTPEKAWTIEPEFFESGIHFQLPQLDVAGFMIVQ